MKGLAENRDREGEAQNSPNIFYENNHLQRNLAKRMGRERRAEIEQSSKNLLGKRQTLPDNRSVRGGKVTSTVRDQRPEMPGEIHLE